MCSMNMEKHTLFIYILGIFIYSIHIIHISDIYDMCMIYVLCKNTQYVLDMYMKSICFSAFILHISGTNRCNIGIKTYSNQKN
jgi:hypothetical protein